MHRGIICAAVVSQMFIAARPVNAMTAEKTQMEEEATLPEAEPTEDGAQETAAPTDDAQCHPACVGHQICKEGACLDPCETPCADTQVCTRNGHCVARSPAPERSATWSTAPRRTAVGAPTPRWRQVHARSPNTDMYAEFERKKNSGAAMMGVGLTFILSAVAMGGAAGATGEPALLYAAIGVEVFGDILFFPGLVRMVVGKNGMRKARNGDYSQGPRVNIHPMISLDISPTGESRKSYGFGLTWTM